MLTIFTCFSLLNKGHRKFVQKLALSCNFSASLRKNQSKFWEHLFPQILCLHNTSIWLLILELISIFLLWALLIFPVSFPIYFPFFINPFPSSKYSSIEKMISFTHKYTRTGPYSTKCMMTHLHWCTEAQELKARSKSLCKK